MTDIDFSLTRRSALFASLASLLQTGTLFAGEKQVITVHKGSNLRLLFRLGAAP